MILVPFDDWKNDCDLEPADCEECDGDGYVECRYCDHTSDCDHCSDGLVEPDYAGVYLNHLRYTVKRLLSCMAVTMSQKKSIVKSIKSDFRLASRYREMRKELRKDAK